MDTMDFIFWQKNIKQEISTKDNKSNPEQSKHPKTQVQASPLALVQQLSKILLTSHKTKQQNLFLDPDFKALNLLV